MHTLGLAGPSRTDAGGLRERKKRQTRQLIADTAAALFAERGYEHVAITDVARAAEVAEQTVYNYFPTKEHLVLDRDEGLQDRLAQLVRDRPPGSSPATAIRSEALCFVDEIRTLPPEQVRGGLGHLSAVSPAVRRLSLEMTDRHGDAMARAIAETTPGISPPLAKVYGMALAWVFQTITDETGRRTVEGHSPAQIAAELSPIVACIVGDIDRWLSDPSNRPQRRQEGG